MARIPVALWFHKSNPAAPQVVLIGEGDNVPQALLDAANSALGADAPENNRIAMHESGSDRCCRKSRKSKDPENLANVDF